MKRIKAALRVIIICVILLITNSVTPISAQESVSKADSLEISLLTCSPHEEIYSLYGHTALRCKDLKTSEDWVFNYGIFSFKKPFFALRFTLGITDYELGVMSFSTFKREYIKYGSQVVEQVLNLTETEKQNLYDALKINSLPKNKTYRYNFFYDNCTTRARDMVERFVKGEIKYAYDDTYAPTYRQIIHEHTVGHPWAAFGNDLCLGAKADIATTPIQQQFIPGKLMHDFDRAQIYSYGTYRPLVKARNIVVEPGVQIIEKDFPFSPSQCAYILLVLSVAIAFIEYKQRRSYKIWDVILMLTTGIAGLIVLALFFSEHPTTSTNLQILILNPITLFFIPQVIKGRKDTYWKLSMYMILLFFIGTFFQDYAEGMEVVALSLLTRCFTHRKSVFKKDKR